MKQKFVKKKAEQPKKVIPCPPLSKADTRYCQKSQSQPCEQMFEVEESKKVEEVPVKQKSVTASTVCNSIMDKNKTAPVMKKDWSAVKIECK